MSVPRDRLGVSTGDVMIGLAFLAVLAALAAPTVQSRRFQARVEATAAEVEELRSAALAHVDETGSWPAPAASGEAPEELFLTYPEGDLRREGYTLQWTRWQVVDSTEAPEDPGPAPLDAPPDSVGPAMMAVVREVGGIALHTGDEALLAELLDRYGSPTSFVRDTTWTLILPRRAGGG